MTASAFDPDKLRLVLRRMAREELLIMAERAMERLPASKLKEVLRDHVRLADILSPVPGATSWLEQAQRFHDAAIEGAYWDPFDVNWRNSTQKSHGTDNFVAEFRRLLDLCVGASRRRPRGPTRKAFELLFELLRRLDEGEEIVFFADEAGSWQVNHYWRVALPAYFRCLADDTAPEDFAREVQRVISDFDDSERPFHLAAAQRIARGEHRAAMRQLESKVHARADD